MIVSERSEASPGLLRNAGIRPFPHSEVLIGLENGQATKLPSSSPSPTALWAAKQILHRLCRSNRLR